MKLAASIALSHLLSRRRQTLVSLAGIGLGVAFFLAVSALMRGSEQDFMRRLVDNSAHITVYDEFRQAKPQAAELAAAHGAVEIRGVKPETEVRGIRQYKQKLDFVSRLPGLRVAPVLLGQAIFTFAGKDLGAAINGIEPDLMKNVSTIDQYFISGSLASLHSDPDGIIIGTGLADKFRAKLGDKISVTSPTGLVRVMKIVALFRTGTAAYDEGQTFIILKRAQTLLGRPNVANRFILKLDDPARAPVVAGQIERALGYKTQSWQEASEDIMNLVKIRNIIMYSVVAATLIVAAFGIYNVISTVVLEKTRDIAILKSIGFHARDIRRIFLIEGALLGLVGSVLGTGLGLALMAGLARVEVKSPFITTQAFLPIYWGWDQMALAAAFAMGSALVAAYLPARKGGRVRPVDILRGAA
ncbi:ABC transporter, permease protein [Pseudogulbenkiania sp. NH8B]|uniref:ABC transporter permease n=1 Tax=Pseudogulbenkiania sp. (strain NH8B) TaxID=748280 RepID=UPI0002279C3F|nr:ABC transporter permease [Pseudogulbenkiania sp. NH8B]BAK76988.1 ABC transporter, permease protein [Pseudogulbenkiania sp. NH8B]